MVFSIAYLTLATDQFARLVDFYSQVLGPPQLSPGYAEFNLAGLRLGIFQPRPDHREEFLQLGAGRASLCIDVPDLGAAIAQLHHLGYPPPGPIIGASHGQEIYAYDPDGNRLILHQRSDPQTC
ncbi:MAG: VOC family protein [Cyanobacteria bacterium REEB459]|nr:VOC family protein [Cyanobacteria bacterium REEB459]